ncbi:hypothetical protein [Sorangium sp. So ce542]|uniref:hypothetical protein n=1 Tax=Sorangium sp. So ce542 TaxID=3133316 RepID=UPI003F5F2982
MAAEVALVGEGNASVGEREQVADQQRFCVRPVCAASARPALDLPCPSLDAAGSRIRGMNPQHRAQCIVRYLLVFSRSEFVELQAEQSNGIVEPLDRQR